MVEVQIMIILYILLFIAVVLALAYFCCRAGFHVPKQTETDLFRFPNSEQYAPYADEMARMVRAALDIPYEDVWIRSHDGLRLHGKFYAANPDAPVQIMFHGYKSGAERDFCGGLQIAVRGGFNVLLVDQRAHGKSEGKHEICVTEKFHNY